MVEKNVVGTYNIKDAYPVFGYEMDDGPSIPAVGAVSGPARIAPINRLGSSIDPVDQWRAFSEQLQARRQMREQMEQGGGPQPASQQPSRPTRPSTAQRDKAFQKDYEQDMVQLDHNYDPVTLGLQRYLSNVRQPVPETVHRTHEAPHEDLATTHGAPGALRIADVMSRKVVCVLESTTIEQVASLCNQRGFSGVPVVDETQGLIGIVTLSDIIRQIFDQKSLSTYSEIGGEILEQKTLAILDEPVRNYMQTQVITVAPEATVREACQLMTAHGIRRLVVARGNLVRGIFSAQDAVRVLAAADLNVAE